ncbi:MAG: protein imuA [Proteobacteria bacterium]|nr:protein imuA [Pseudomonadota bacterium]MBW3616989.1 protein imuA [Pseudomonadota bacterium]
MRSGAEHRLRALRERLAAIEGGKRTGRVLPFGDGRVDACLPGGGLPRGRWHEITGEGLEQETAAAPAAWSARLGSRLLSDGGGEAVWIGQSEDLHAPGLAALGLRPIFVLVRNDTEALAAAEDALRARGVAAVWAEVAGLDLTAGRRLQLACEAHGATGFVLRRRLWAHKGGAETGAGSASRWRIAAAPSNPGHLPGLGPARWRVWLERAAGGRPGAWIMEMGDEADRIRVVSELAADGLAAAEPSIRRAG